MSSTKKSKRRRQRASQPGDWVAIALADGTWGLAQVVRITYASGPTFVLFSQRSATTDGLTPDTPGKPVAAMNATDDMVEDWLWPILRTTPVARSLLSMPLPDERRSTVALSAVDILDHLHGVRSLTTELVEWQSKWMLPGVALPPGVDVLDQPAAVAASGAMPDDGNVDDVTSGPALVKVVLRYEGVDMPSDEDQRRMDRIENEVTRAGLGEVTDTGGGDGVLDIWFETQDAAHARAAVRDLLEREGVTARSSVHAEELDDETDAG